MADGVHERIEARGHLAHQRGDGRGQRRDVVLVHELADDDHGRVGRPRDHPQADVRQRDLGHPDLGARRAAVLAKRESS